MYYAPGAQALAPVPAATPAAVPPASCPAVPHCATLPSAQSAYQAVSGNPIGWLKVARDLVVRGGLVWTGIAVYDAVTGQKDPHRFARAVAGAAGIEVFVLGYTWLTTPSPQAAVPAAVPQPLAPAARAFRRL